MLPVIILMLGFLHSNRYLFLRLLCSEAHL
jgi:hypothetical protein